METDSIGEGEYFIQKQEDGNYKGWTRKFGRVIEAREIGPDTVLARLLTSDGKD